MKIFKLRGGPLAGQTYEHAVSGRPPQILKFLVDHGRSHVFGWKSSGSWVSPVIREHFYKRAADVYRHACPRSANCGNPV